MGFNWGGWPTSGTAQQSQTEVVPALTPICLDQSKRDPQPAERILHLKAVPPASEAIS
jgi:hypothetical protein